jgi:hypothetical protein
MTPRAEDIREDEGGLFDWLFGGAEGVPEAHRRTYRRSIYQQGNVALSVRAIHSDPEYHRICDLLERHDPLDVEESGSVHSASLEGAGAQVASPTAKAMEPPTDYKPPAGRRRRARAYPIRSQ